MELTFREGCWIKFCAHLLTVMSLIITTACVISLINRYNAGLLELQRQLQFG